MRLFAGSICLLLGLAATAGLAHGQSDSEIRRAIVKECLGIYHASRPCACPDDRMRNGRRCGGVSAYARPGGASPFCHEADVTAQQVTEYRRGRKDFLSRCAP